MYESKRGTEVFYHSLVLLFAFFHLTRLFFCFEISELSFRLEGTLGSLRFLLDAAFERPEPRPPREEAGADGNSAG